MTSTLTDDRLNELLRGADPLAGGAPPSAADADAALRRLLERGPGGGRAGRRGPRHPRRLASRGALAVTVGAALVLGIVNVIPSRGPASVGPAWAHAVLRHAAAAIGGSRGSILHVDTLATESLPGTKPKRWESDTWQQLGSPYDERTIVSGLWPTPIQMAIVNGQQWLYDPGTNKIYVDGSSQPYTVRAGASAGTYLLQPAGYKGAPVQISAAQLQALRDGSDTIDYYADGKKLVPVVIPQPRVGPQTVSSFRPQALALLHSRGARVASDASIEGRSAIRVSSADGSTVYYIDPHTFQPIELSHRQNLYFPPSAGPGVFTLTLRFAAYQQLSGAAAAPALLSLSAEHPSAPVVYGDNGYQAASKRLFR